MGSRFGNAERELLRAEVNRLTDGGKDCAKAIDELARNAVNEGVRLAANRTLLHVLGVATDSPQRVEIADQRETMPDKVTQLVDTLLARAYATPTAENLYEGEEGANERRLKAALTGEPTE